MINPGSRFALSLENRIEVLCLPGNKQPADKVTPISAANTRAWEIE